MVVKRLWYVKKCHLILNSLSFGLFNSNIMPYRYTFYFSAIYQQFISTMRSVLFTDRNYGDLYWVACKRKIISYYGGAVKIKSVHAEMKQIITPTAWRMKRWYWFNIFPVSVNLVYRRCVAHYMMTGQHWRRLILCSKYLKWSKAKLCRESTYLKVS